MFDDMGVINFFTSFAHPSTEFGKEITRLRFYYSPKDVSSWMTLWMTC